MVSTQNTFFPAAGFPGILAASPVTKNMAVRSVLATPPVIPAPPVQLNPTKINTIIDQVNTESEAVLRGISFNGDHPKSVSQLLAMGAKRNHALDADHPIDEKTAFNNDVAYFKVLLAARERHRAAMQVKLQALRKLRIKQRKVYKKRTSPYHAAAATVASIAPSNRRKSASLLEKHISLEENWDSPLSKTICPSPVSTDVESDTSSDAGDMDVSNGKMGSF